MKRIFEKNSSLTVRLGFIALILCAAVCLCSAAVGLFRIFAPIGEYGFVGTLDFERTATPEEEGYDEDSTKCLVEYESADGTIMNVEYSYEDWESLTETHRIGYVYENVKTGDRIGFADHPTEAQIAAEVRNRAADDASALFGAALALGLFAIGLGIILIFRDKFSAYEKYWFLSILALAAIFSLIFPEDSCNGVNGIVIMALYLADTLLNILCELLISKQSKWNFIVSVFVEITEILICVVLAYRFATMLSTLLFWLPCDIVSFINWNRKPDSENEEITKVRTLKGWQEALLIVGIIVWTVGIGFLLSNLNWSTDLFGGNRTLEVIVCYLDACASAVGILNGLGILFRFREQWLAWYLCAILEAAINVLSGQYVLLVLKAGYLTNTTYGYVKWTKYISAHPEVLEEKTLF